MRSPVQRHGPFRYRLRHDVPIVLAAAILVAAVWNAALIIPPLVPEGILGADFRIYRDAAAEWLRSGAFYAPHQLLGPYAIGPGDVLYPPTILYLLVPFIALPAFLWWAIPLTIIAAVTIRLHPARWAWPVLALAIWWPRDQGLVVLGNPGMWVGAAVAAGLMLGWPSAFVALKPSLVPFALIGIRTHGWWRATAAVFLGSVGLVGLWLQYAIALSNSDFTLGYSVLDLPFMLIPVVAWIARTDRVRSPIRLTARPWIRRPGSWRPRAGAPANR